MDSKDDEIVSAPLEENDQRPPEVLYPVTVLYSTPLLCKTFFNVTVFILYLHRVKYKLQMFLKHQLLSTYQQFLNRSLRKV